MVLCVHSFALPSSFEVNVTRTPAGPVAYVPEWEERRRALLAKLTPHGLICKDYRQCHRLEYESVLNASEHTNANHAHILSPLMP